jgi:hypothetical protein
MLENFQRYFRFYLASFLLSLLLVGIRWGTAPLGASQLESEATPVRIPAARAAHTGVATMAVR